MVLIALIAFSRTNVLFGACLLRDKLWKYMYQYYLKSKIKLEIQPVLISSEHKLISDEMFFIQSKNVTKTQRTLLHLHKVFIPLPKLLFVDRFIITHEICITCPTNNIMRHSKLINKLVIFLSHP